MGNWWLDVIPLKINVLKAKEQASTLSPDLGKAFSKTP